MPNLATLHPAIVHFAVALLVVAALEVLALVLAKRNTRAARGALMGSAIVGGIGLWALYEAGEHGGDLVYRYAGGVGIRYDDTADVNRHG